MVSDEAPGMDEKAEVGRRLAQARKARGYSQVRAAELAGVDQTTISKAERGQLRLDAEKTAPKIADALGVTVQWLLRGKGAGPTIEAPATVAEAAEESGARRIEAPDLTALTAALDEAFDRSRGHRLADVDAVRRELAAYPLPATVSHETLTRVAGRLLDAAAEIRVAGDAVSMGALLLKVAV